MQEQSYTKATTSSKTTEQHPTLKGICIVMPLNCKKKYVIAERLQLFILSQKTMFVIGLVVCKILE